MSAIRPHHVMDLPARLRGAALADRLPRRGKRCGVARMLWFALLAHLEWGGDRPVVWAGDDHLAYVLGTSSRAVCEALLTLKHHGLVEVVRSGGRRVIKPILTDTMYGPAEPPMVRWPMLRAEGRMRMASISAAVELLQHDRPERGVGGVRYDCHLTLLLGLYALAAEQGSGFTEPRRVTTSMAALMALTGQLRGRATDSRLDLLEARGLITRVSSKRGEIVVEVQPFAAWGHEVRRLRESLPPDPQIDLWDPSELDRQPVDDLEPIQGFDVPLVAAANVWEPVLDLPLGPLLAAPAHGVRAGVAGPRACPGEQTRGGPTHGAGPPLRGTG